MANNLKIAEAFAFAKLHLSTKIFDYHKHTFICNALRTAYVHGEINEQYYIQAKIIIQNRLNESYTVEDWLQYYQGVNIEKTSYNNIQKYRHAWLDSLIEEFSKE
jgi:hypothetical protein